MTRESFDGPRAALTLADITDANTDHLRSSPAGPPQSHTGTPCFETLNSLLAASAYFVQTASTFSSVLTPPLLHRRKSSLPASQPAIPCGNGSDSLSIDLSSCTIIPAHSQSNVSLKSPPRPSNFVTLGRGEPLVQIPSLAVRNPLYSKYNRRKKTPSASPTTDSAIVCVNQRCTAAGYFSQKQKMAVLNQIMVEVFHVLARDTQSSSTTPSDHTQTIVPSSPSPTTGSSPSSSPNTAGTGPTSSPLLFFVALGFGVVFTNLW